MQGGDLHDALHVGKSRLEWKAGGCRLAAQIALGLSKLHARKVSILAHVSTLHPASALVEGEFYLQVQCQAAQTVLGLVKPLVGAARCSTGIADRWLCTRLTLS